eukprot:scaffold94714_cov17-Prasinocladus_malaysianus.AAC.1
MSMFTCCRTTMLSLATMLSLSLAVVLRCSYVSIRQPVEGQLWAALDALPGLRFRLTGVMAGGVPRTRLTGELKPQEWNASPNEKVWSILKRNNSHGMALKTIDFNWQLLYGQFLLQHDDFSTEQTIMARFVIDSRWNLKTNAVCDRFLDAFRPMFASING